MIRHILDALSAAAALVVVVLAWTIAIMLLTSRSGPLTRVPDLAFRCLGPLLVLLLIGALPDPPTEN